MPLRHKDAPFLSQFPGLQLLRQDGSTVPASEAFKGKKYVLIYFSAHWCPPCQRFTPLLADFYDEHKDTYDFEVLFVSSDREEGRMMDFFQNRSSNYVRRPAQLDSAAMTGAADPSKPDAEAVSATATAAAAAPLPLDNGEGTMMGCDMSSSSKATSPSSSPVVGATAMPYNFPSDTLKLRSRSSNNSTTNSNDNRSTNMSVKATGNSSSNRTSNGVRIPKASGHGNWLALPFKETEVARFLSRAYSVVSIPKLVVVAVDTSCVVTREGKAMVMKDPDALKFPWRFAEGAMAPKQENMRECVALFILLIIGVYYYIWGF